MKKINKSVVLKVVVLSTISVVAFFLLGLGRGDLSLSPKFGIWFITSLFVVAIILPFEVEKDDGIRFVVTIKQKKLKWSTLMGPCTWDEAVAVATKQGDGWRLPTAVELNVAKQKTQTDTLWVRNRNKILSCHGGAQLMPERSKAYFYIVRRV